MIKLIELSEEEAREKFKQIRDNELQDEIQDKIQKERKAAIRKAEINKLMLPIYNELAKWEEVLPHKRPCITDKKAFAAAFYLTMEHGEIRILDRTLGNSYHIFHDYNWEDHKDDYLFRPDVLIKLQERIPKFIEYVYINIDKIDKNTEEYEKFKTDTRIHMKKTLYEMLVVLIVIILLRLIIGR